MFVSECVEIDVGLRNRVHNLAISGARSAVLRPRVLSADHKNSRANLRFWRPRTRKYEGEKYRTSL